MPPPPHYFVLLFSFLLLGYIVFHINRLYQVRQAKIRPKVRKRRRRRKSSKPERKTIRKEEGGGGVGGQTKSDKVFLPKLSYNERLK